MEARSDLPRIWLISELYYPELTSTGYFLTAIAEGLAEAYDVSVLCGQPSYWARGIRAPVREMRNGVDVRRCRATTLDKNRLSFRITNLVTITVSILLTATLRFRRGDIVIAVTNPPLLPYVAALACRMRKGRFILLVHDVYPDIMTRLGILKRQSISARLLDRGSRWLYDSAARVIVIGRDMRNLVASKLQSRPDRVLVATNWANTETISPEPRSRNQLLRGLRLNEKLVVQYWGNMGRPHCIEDIVNAAQLSASDSDIHFLLIGWGTRKGWAVAEKEARGLENLTILDPLHRDQSCDVQNACDVSINTLCRGMAGISVPSRTYNAMAAGKPLIAVCDNDSELAMVVKEEEIGWVIPPGRPDLIVAALIEAKADPERLHAMGKRARNAVETKYTFEYVAHIYRSMIESMRYE